MTHEPTKAAPAVALSLLSCPDMVALGLSKGHLEDARVDIALWLLADGMSLAYGGDDLRRNRFTEMLYEMLIRYQDHPQHNHPVAVTNYLAWPAHSGMGDAELAEFCAGHRDVAGLVFLGPNGERVEAAHQPLRARQAPPSGDWEARLTAMREKHSAGRKLSRKEWEAGMTAMRRMMRDETQAHVVLGGRPDKYQRRLPRIAEESLLTLEAGQPLFLLGGFGGCARSIAEVLGLVEPWAGSYPEWPGRAAFDKYAAADLRNGLSREENAILADTPFTDQAIALICRGLRKSHITNCSSAMTRAQGKGKSSQGFQQAPAPPQ